MKWIVCLLIAIQSTFVFSDDFDIESFTATYAGQKIYIGQSFDEVAKVADLLKLKKRLIPHSEYGVYQNKGGEFVPNSDYDRILFEDDCISIYMYRKFAKVYSIELPRDCRRPKSLRGYSHGQRKQVLPRGTRTGG